MLDIIGPAGPLMYLDQISRYSPKRPKILKLCICLRESYNSGIILSKMFTYCSQNYAGIIGAGLLCNKTRAYSYTSCIAIYTCSDRKSRPKILNH